MNPLTGVARTAALALLLLASGACTRAERAANPAASRHAPLVFQFHRDARGAVSRLTVDRGTARLHFRRNAALSH